MCVATVVSFLTNPMHEIPSGFLVCFSCLWSLSLHNIPSCQPISTSLSVPPFHWVQVQSACWWQANKLRDEILRSGTGKPADRGDSRLGLWNTILHVSFWVSVFVSLGYIPSSGIAGSCGRFSFLRSVHTVFHNGCTNLHSYKQFLHRKKDFSPHSHQHLLFVVSLIITILTDVRGYLFDLHFSY